MNELKFGWHMPSFPVDGSDGRAFIEQIDHTLDRVHSHFDSVWVDDHLMPWAEWQSNDTPYLECMTTITHFAARYPSLNFGASVLCQSYRNPALLAKMAANLQLLTGGRFIFGIGAGWMEEEYSGLQLRLSQGVGAHCPVGRDGADRQGALDRIAGQFRGRRTIASTMPTANRGPTRCRPF